MVKVDKEVFEHRYKQLMEVTIRKSDFKQIGTTEISFNTGLWDAEEGYKRDIWEKARRILDLDSWDKHRNDPQYIIKKVTDTMVVVDSEGSRQNLVSISNIIKVLDVLHVNPQKTAEIFYEIYKTDSDEQSFNKLANLINVKSIYDPFSIAAYLFFLKDKEKYVPVRKDANQDRLRKMGLKFECMKKCSWDNYMEFMDIIGQLQELLQENLGSEVTLLDAQSFLWMLWMVDENTSEYDSLVEEGNETCVTTGYKEGRITEYYVKKYERDSRNRAAAIRIHGYKCMACGFDFSEKYGELGANYIEVHHVVPLSTRDEEVIVNPETDLICLCANCHRMVHHKKNAIVTLNELRDVIEQQRKTV